MRRFVVLDKPIGQTPLAAIQMWKLRHPDYANVPASYAGRLDPMASGKLLILFGEECKRQKEYTNLDKEYVIEVLLDIGSDTGDVLGITTTADKATHPDSAVLAAVLRRELGAHERAYPAFSSKTVSGKPLFLHTLEESLHPNDIPKHMERIFHVSLLDTSTISASILTERVSDLLSLAPHTDEPSKRLGDNFRIDAVRASWQSVFTSAGDRRFTILRLRVICASGTYMRSLAGRIGSALGTHALALSIRRTKIGRYTALWKTGLWIRSY